jgi:hypothetical protein
MLNCCSVVCKEGGGVNCRPADYEFSESDFTLFGYDEL